MTTAPENPAIVDVPGEDRFVFTDGPAVAELVYHVTGDRLILIHTGVPDELGGRGLGGQLVRAAVTRASREHLTVVPWCPFARHWLEQHPDAAAHVSVDWESQPPQGD